MENNIDQYKEEVDKINLRIKEYLWKAQYKSKNCRSK